MAQLKVLLLFLYIMCLCSLVTCLNTDLSYTELLSSLERRLNSERHKSTHILNSIDLLDSLEALDRRSLLQQANNHFNQREFDLFKTAVSYNVSEKCLNHTKIFLEGLFGRQTWALKMIDSLGKLPSDVLEGNLAWFGSYDECKKIRAAISRNNSGKLTQEYPFRGQFCQIGVPLAPVDPANPMSGLFAYLRLGTCFPDSCSSADALALVNTALSLLPLGNTTITATIGKCQENNLEYDTKAIAVLIVCGIFITILVIATLYDILIKQLPKQSQLAKSIEILNGEATGYTTNSHNQDEYKPLLGDHKPVETTNEPSMFEKLLLSFSVYSNGKKLLSTKQASGSLECIHGIRFFSMTWVILGHTYAFCFNSASNLATFFPEVLNRWTFQAIGNALVSVDSFFTISGLLMSYLVLKEMKKNDGKLNWPMYYFHRFWRLTPPYMLVMMVYVPLFPYFSEGPIWPQQGVEKDFCEDSWWTNLLYVNNFVNVNSGCFGWAWYLANDMQFYVISPLLFVPLFYSEIIGVIVCLVALLGVSVTTGVISTVDKLPPSLIGGGENTDGTYYMEHYYIKPYTRMGPYIVGILVGYILYKTKCQVKLNKFVNLAGWVVATGLACAVLYGLYDPINGRNPLSVEVSSLYNTTHRTVWGACLCWVIFSCVTGNGGFVNTILSWSAIVPLSRLTYCAYLVHPIIMYTYYNSVRQPLYLTDFTMIILFLGFLVISYGVAFVVSLAFESPMMGLEKAVFRRGEHKVNK